MYYMTLPRLYEHVTLRAYSEIRYVDGRPEGYGGGSPFAMGLNTLVSRNFNNYIRRFRVLGNWREQDTEDYRHGRVPDSSMVLQVAMRAAIDRMTNLDSFAYVGPYTLPSNSSSLALLMHFQLGTQHSTIAHYLPGSCG